MTLGIAIIVSASVIFRHILSLILLWIRCSRDSNKNYAQIKFEIVLIVIQIQIRILMMLHV